ncbi:hypothetical protein DRQ25_14505 [Candidatus Fermentibacteria bacterium]|nr:MAG: hypothetical protein DRQ25_14505 [Candidatus Fermentibacteria bacterium]
MKLQCYKESLKMSKAKIGKMLVPVKAKRAKKQAELEMCKMEEALAVKEAALHEECCKEDVSFSGIIKTQDEIALLERKIKQYQRILDEMFPEE